MLWEEDCLEKLKEVPRNSVDSLITDPPAGVILDPFMGSGSTGIAVRHLGYSFVGIEKQREYFQIAQKRIQAAKETKVV